MEVFSREASTNRSLHHRIFDRCNTPLEAFNELNKALGGDLDPNDYSRVARLFRDYKGRQEQQKLAALKARAAKSDKLARLNEAILDGQVKPTPIPDKLREAGLTEYPSFPYCSRGKGVEFIDNKRREAAKAWKMAYVQADHANSKPMVVLDGDDEDRYVALCLKMEALGLGRPSWVAKRKGCTTRQVVFVLTTPVHDNGRARNRKALDYWRGIFRGLNAEYGDPGYAGKLMWNPLHGDYETVWRDDGKTFALDELQLLVPPRRSTTISVKNSLGRNASLYDSLLGWHGRPSHWNATDAEILAEAHNVNGTFGRSPLRQRGPAHRPIRPRIHRSAGPLGEAGGRIQGEAEGGGGEKRQVPQAGQLRA